MDAIAALNPNIVELAFDDATRCGVFVAPAPPAAEFESAESARGDA